MSNKVRDILFIAFFVYCVATQYMLNNYDKMNNDLLNSISNLMGVCTNGETPDLYRNYKLFREDAQKRGKF